MILKVFSVFFVIGTTIAQLALYSSWKDIEYMFPTPQDRTNAINSRKYIQGNAVPIDTDVYYPAYGPPKVFMTMPRFLNGTPITLGTVSTTMGPKGPQMQAFPNYLSQSSHGADCNGITSVFRIKVDKCGRLWVMDSGKIGDIQFCQPQVLVYDLKTETLVSRYQIPRNQYVAASLFITIEVDVRQTCQNTMVYLADVTGFGLVVYDYQAQISWRITHKLFQPQSKFGTYTIEGESFELLDGLLGLAVSPFNDVASCQTPIQRERRLYFQALSSETLNAVPLSIIDNRSLFLNNPGAYPEKFVALGYRNTQSGPLAMDCNGNIYYGLVPTSLGSWNIANYPNFNSYTARFLMNDRQTLQFISGLKVIKDPQGVENLWIVSNRLQKFYTGSTNYNEINFRIQYGRI